MKKEEWYKRKRASEYLGISQQLLTRLEEEKRIKHLSIPAKKKRISLYKQEWLDEFKEKNTVEVAA